MDLGVKDLGSALKRLCSGKNPVTGIFTTADNCAYRIYSEAYRMGIRVPDDLSVIGFDDLNMSAMITPHLRPLDRISRKKRLSPAILLMKQSARRIRRQRISS